MRRNKNSPLFMHKIKIVTKKLPTIIKSRNCVPAVFSLMLCFFTYDYILLLIEYKNTKCAFICNDSSTILPATMNLKRIKQLFSKRGDFFIPSSLKQKDWHNYTQIEYEAQRVGNGEQGKAASLPPEDQELGKKLFFVYGFNALLSDRLPLNRSLPDLRNPACKKKLYLESLPTVSIVVPFHDERWSSLLRTAYSALYRAPDYLVKEVFLVDDASAKEHRSEIFDNFIKEHMPKVKVIRLEKRSGIVGARLAGAKLATADVLIFLDAHTEANVNWLPPLIEPIALDYRMVTVPLIDVVRYTNMEYRIVDEGARGAFDWGLTYMRLSLPPKDKARLPEPFETPVMLGGLFAVSRKFFWELGGYDPELFIWGGEQYEISFKIWMCGGRMIEVPCSRFGHIYRKHDPPDHSYYTARNFRRIAEVWMDEYKEYVWARRPQDKWVDPGDMSEQMAIRKKLKCKSFKWFITQIAFDLLQQFPLVDPPPYAEGRIRPKESPHLCVDGNHGDWNDPFILKRCNIGKDIRPQDDDQIFVLTWHNDVKLKYRYICWDLHNWGPGTHLTQYPCHHSGGNQLWRYDVVTQQFIYSGMHPRFVCLDHNASNRDLFLNMCDNKTETQRWHIDKIYEENMAKWNISNAYRVTGPEIEWNE